MEREEFLRRLHPAITHINASDKMDEDTLEAINAMVDKVFHMSKDEIEELAAKGKKYRAWEAKVIMEAEYYPTLKKCNGRFNVEMMRSFYERGFTPISACNAMLDAT